MNDVVDSVDSSERLPLGNAEVAVRLDEIAALLEGQNANPFRVRAYRIAADVVRGLEEPVHERLLREGTEGLTALPGIGRALARAIERLAETGRLRLLDQLRGDGGAERVLTTVPGVGPKTAARIHDELGIETLVELEAAAWDGRLAQIEGMGSKKVRSVREALAGRFRRPPQSFAPVPGPHSQDVPTVDELLSVDEEYRRKAAADRLLRIAPKRFNPTGEAWLPILHTHRDNRHYTALYSNTARAHELGATRDWVVIYRDDAGGDGQWTVVTARLGPLKGRRVVRGRERECEGHASTPPLSDD